MARRVSRIVGLFRFTPAHVGEGGQMALADHLRELRARLLMVVLALVVATTVALFFYDQLFAIIFEPYKSAARQVSDGVKTEPIITGAATGLLLQLKLSALAAVVVVSPFWLYQVWAFVVPGLHPNERKWTRVFAAVAGPLFMAGVAIGYFILPKGLTVLINFTPGGVTNFIEFGDYFTFLVRMLLVFGIAFEIPLFVIMLNLAGVLPASALRKYRPWIIVGTFVFAAVATPSTDPFSMLMLAIPVLLLMLVSEGVARRVDARRGAKKVALAGHDGADR